MFLRGDNEEDLEKYLGRVSEMTENIQLKTAEIVEHPMAAPYRRDIEAFAVDHAELMAVYRQGIEIFQETNDHRAGDAYVRGEGSDVGEEISQALDQIQRDRRQLLQDKERSITRFLAFSTGGLIVFILGCSGILAIAITHPMRRIARFTSFLEESRQSRAVREVTGDETVGGEAQVLPLGTDKAYEPLEGQRCDEIGYMIDRYSKLASLISDYSHNLEQKVKDRTVQLASANAEITKLNCRLEAENMRMSAELAISRQLQELILPKDKELQQVEQLEIATFMEPAAEVGGDYYDVLQFNGRTQIGIGDVTGHGLESGMLMLMAQTAVRTLLIHGETDPVKVLNTLNQTIYANVQRMKSDRNMTLSLLDYDAGKVSLTGQHEEVIVVRQSGDLERLDTIDLGFPIGLESDISDFVAEAEITLEPGDGIVLYTDGITEAENRCGSYYGVQRLCDTVSQHWLLPAEEIRRRVIQDVQAHIGSHKMFDDITLLVLKRPVSQSAATASSP